LRTYSVFTERGLILDYLKDLGFIFSGALAVAGIIQLLKNFLKKLPGWAWAVILIGFAIGYIYLPSELKNAFLIAAVAQLGYDALIKPAKNKLG
jgi:uncharacterized oligopeptide transporter (OPT) family protein